LGELRKGRLNAGGGGYKGRNNEDKTVRQKGTPAHLCIHTLAVSSPNNFLLQVLHDKDVRRKITPSVLAVEVLTVTSPD
jgi:hypothetical protein